LRKFDEILARARNIDEGTEEFRKFKEESEERKSHRKARTAHDGNGRYLVAHNKEEMIRKLHEGQSLVQSLTGDKYLLEVERTVSKMRKTLN
jgi:hypothetical protein